MTRPAGGTVTEFVAECLWPGVRESDLRTLDERASASAQRLSADRGRVNYLGSLLMPEDEVVLCLFSGELDSVRCVATDAQIPFGRILEAARSPWGMDATVQGDGEPGIHGPIQAAAQASRATTFEPE